MDRDENSAVNILVRYFARRGPHIPRGCGVLQVPEPEVVSMELTQIGEVQQLNLFEWAD